MEWLTLAEAVRWAQIGFCLAVGMALAYGVGYVLVLIFGALLDLAS